MRRNLLLTVALAVAGFLVVVGSAGARQDELLDSGSAGVQVDLPAGQDLPPLDSLPQCSNQGDDDADGAMDVADPECSGPLDDTEDQAEPTEPPDARGASRRSAGGPGAGPGRRPR